MRSLITPTLCLGAVLAGAPSAALAQDGRDDQMSLQIENYLTPERELQLFSRLSGLYVHQWSELGWGGIFLRFQLDNKYKQGQLGFVFKPRPLVQFGLGAGYGAAAFLWLGNNNLALTLNGSANISKWSDLLDPWYEARFDYVLDQVSGSLEKPLTLGIMVRRSAGVGLRLGFVTPRLGIKIWVAPLYQLENGKLTGLLGLDLDV